MKSKCINCDKEINITECQIRYNRGKFCSTKCKYEYATTKLKIKCEYCGKETKNLKYCSNDCFSRANGRVDNICPRCGNTFHNNRKKYCSKKCYIESQIKEKVLKNKCIVCGDMHNNKIYCSEKCQYIGYKKEKVERIIVYCHECKKEIITIPSKIRGEFKFCSKKYIK